MKRTVLLPRRRRGFTSIDLVLIIGILLILAALILPQIQVARDGGGRGGTCRNNMRGAAFALFAYQNRMGHYPGYMNALERTDGTPYVAPQTGRVTPVSWAVMVLPELDRTQLFDAWRDPKFPLATASATGSPSTGTSTASLTTTALDRRLIYLEQLCCPSDAQGSKKPLFISFVPNTGMPDAPRAIVEAASSRFPTRQDAASTSGIPRDWPANGMLFDNFTEHPLIKPDTKTRGPMFLMRDEMIADPKDKTILLTENVDATEYAFDAQTQSADGWRAVEIQTGCIWQPGPAGRTTHPPTMQPPASTMHINSDVGQGNGTSFNYCRPSSRHPQHVNVAFAGQNVTSLRDTISYFVYAKLMASDDRHVAMPGTRRLADDDPANPIDARFRTYDLTDADLNP